MARLFSLTVKVPDLFTLKFRHIFSNTFSNYNIPAWSDIDLVAQAVLFFMAGYESISTATSFALHELTLHQDVQERLYQEIKEEDRRNGGRISFTSIQNMTYMDMVISGIGSGIYIYLFLAISMSQFPWLKREQDGIVVSSTPILGN